MCCNNKYFLFSKLSEIISFFCDISDLYGKSVTFAVLLWFQRVVVCWWRGGPLRSTQDHLWLHSVCGQNLCCSASGEFTFFLHFFHLRLTCAVTSSASLVRRVTVFAHASSVLAIFLSRNARERETPLSLVFRDRDWARAGLVRAVI